MMQSGQARGRIAVIDDDPTFVELMRDLLTDGEGYEVLTAPHLLQTIEFVKSALPDLIILDLMLGWDQTGWGVLELLREDPCLARIPVILCSASTPALLNRHAPAAGHAAVAVVSKPFDLDDMLGVVNRLLGGSTASQQ